MLEQVGAAAGRVQELEEALGAAQHEAAEARPSLHPTPRRERDRERER